MKKISLFFFFFILILLSVSNGFAQEKILQIGSQRQLFVDDYLIDQLKSTNLQMGIPHDEGNVLPFDKSWEGPFCNYVTIIKADSGKYQAYYRGSPKTKDGNNSEVSCMAVSNDGIHWTKPDLGIFSSNGNFKNNIVLADQAPSSHNFSPFIDRNPKVAKSEKYKALALGRGKTRAYSLLPYVSPDGIHWKKLQETPVITEGTFDSQNVAFWSGSENCYVSYFRTWTKGDFKGIRTVSRTTSTDFIKWTAPVEMAFGDTPMEEIYIQQTSPYYRAAQIYLAIGARFMPGREVLTAEDAKRLQVNPAYFKDLSDVVLMSTRGGNVYNRKFMESFIRPGIGLHNWVSRTNYPALNVVPTGTDEMSIYLVQDYAQPSAHLQRYSLRVDGFSSVHSNYHPGEMITKSFTFSGKEMEINFSTSAAGEIHIVFEEENGEPIEGFSLKNAKPIIGNETRKIVSWDGNTDVKKLEGKTVRLHFYLKDADLYSFKFNN